MAFTTLTFLATSAQAAHPHPEPTRQILPANGHTSERAQSRIFYLSRDPLQLRPGDNDATAGTSSVATQETVVGGWDIDDDSWQQTVSCIRDMYSRWDVTVTDQDPGDVPHILAHIGGSPEDLGLDDTVAGISPFTTDCGIIENSIVFTFTDVLDDDPQYICEVMSQEIAHSFGLDHEMLAPDPMTYLDYAPPRSFQDEDASCGEYEPRDCGVNGSVCRASQNSVQLLTERLGLAAGASDGDDGDTTTKAHTGLDGIVSGCSTSRGGSGGIAMALAMLALRRRRRH
ncbi:MAG TPA: hypothetical protein VGM88_22890 [Kofleriaceae bacterium]